MVDVEGDGVGIQNDISDVKIHIPKLNGMSFLIAVIGIAYAGLIENKLVAGNSPEPRRMSGTSECIEDEFIIWKVFFVK